LPTGFDQPIVKTCDLSHRFVQAKSKCRVSCTWVWRGFVGGHILGCNVRGSRVWARALRPGWPWRSAWVPSDRKFVSDQDQPPSFGRLTSLGLLDVRSRNGHRIYSRTRWYSSKKSDGGCQWRV